MRRLALALSLLLIAGCAPADEQDTTEAQEPETAEAAAPAAVPLADFAGTWSMRALSEAGDSVIVEYTLVASGDPEGWSVIFPDRDPIPARVTLADADSVVLEVGPYPSALREGVNVSTRTVTRLVDGRLMGTFVAHYDTDAADSVLRGRQEGTRSN